MGNSLNCNAVPCDFNWQSSRGRVGDVVSHSRISILNYCGFCKSNQKGNKMEIRNWIHAIDLTIERHQAALDRKYGDYIRAADTMKPDNWNYYCPLCEYSAQIKDIRCSGCPWVIFTNGKCFPSQYMNNKKSIKRLENWKEKLKKKENERI